MEIHSCLTFIGAAIVLCIVPGPDMLFLIGRSIANGKRIGLYAALGINTGAYVHLFAAVAGLTAVLATSAIAFTLVKLAGAAYLIYLGVTTLLSKSSLAAIDTNQGSSVSYGQAFWQGFVSDVLNPKVAMFYLAILPQFVQVDAGNTGVQLLILGVTLNLIGLVSNLLYVYFAAYLSRRLREGVKTTEWLKRALGGLFIALGIKLASERS